MENNICTCSNQPSNVVVDDGDYIAVICLDCSGRWPDRKWPTLMASLQPGSSIHVEKAAQDFDRVMKMWLIDVSRHKRISLMAYPNQVVINEARDQGIRFKESKDKEEHYRAASLLRQRILAGTHGMPMRINKPGKFDFLNKVRREATEIYQMLRTSQIATRELPTVEGYTPSEELRDRIALEESTVARLSGLVKHAAPAEWPQGRHYDREFLQTQILDNQDRLLKFVALIETCLKHGGGFQLVWDVGGFFAHSNGSAWSAYKDREWLAAWIRSQHPDEITHPKARLVNRPFAAYKEFKKEWRDEFSKKFKPALKWLFTEVQASMGLRMAATA